LKFLQKMEKTKAQPLEKWGKLAARQDKNKIQAHYLYKIAKNSNSSEDRFIALKAAGALQICNTRHIVKKEGNQYTPIGCWNCGKKYCAVCSNKKRVKLLFTFKNYFIDNADGKELLKKYDLGLFTLTLKHTKDALRSKPYYKELSTHFRNALKYGSFKKIIAGGFYNTEHTYGKNGHHIHRHALVLIPKKFNLYKNYENLETELREQWRSRTGGSFQIDLRPLGYDSRSQTPLQRHAVLTNLGTHLLEITKYITKRDGGGVIDWEIIKAVEQNNRAKFYGRFGILHKVKELNLNQEKENLEVDQVGVKDELFTCNIYVKRINHITEHIAKSSKISSKKINGILHQKIKLIDGEKIKSWTRIAVSYECKNLMPFHNTKENRQRFKELEQMRYFSWRLKKYQDLANGYDVDKWKEQKNAYHNFVNNNLTTICNITI
jgi:hypothetical protein